MKSRTLVLVAAFLLAPALAGASVPSDKAVQKVIKTLVNAIRYKKDDLAAKQVAFAAMTEAIMGKAWKDLPDGDRAELTRGLETLVRKISFAKGRDLFGHIDAVLYDKVRMEDGRAVCKTTVVVHRNYKKAELIIDFVLANDSGKWKVVDTIMLGQSTLEGIRVDQIEPLIDEGGTPAVMKAMRDKLAQLK